VSVAKQAARTIPGERNIALAAFVAGEGGASITGAVLPIDGGWTAQ
jgi:hypothetical protein